MYSAGMYAKVLKLRRNGVLIGHSLTRELQGLEPHVQTGFVEMSRGKHFVLRSSTSGPGIGTLAELYAPTLVSVDYFWIQVRGFEKGVIDRCEAGVLQEWVVWPLKG